MALLDKPATLHGIEGVLVGTLPAGTIWQAEVATDRLLAFLRDGAEGAILVLRSDAGVVRARVRRCWVESAAPRWRLRVALEAHALA